MKRVKLFINLMNFASVKQLVREYNILSGENFWYFGKVVERKTFL